MLTRRVLTALSTLALALGLTTFVAGPSAATSSLELVATSPSTGALRLTATNPGWVGVQGTVVFTLEGHGSVRVPLGQWTVIGSPKFDESDYGDVMFLQPQVAILDIPGLDPTGTYTATATYVPADSSDPVLTDALPTTTTLARMKTQLTLDVHKWGRNAAFHVRVAAYPVGTFVGKFHIVDLTTGQRVVRGASAQAKLADDGVRALSGRASRGVHQYRIFFTPKPAYRHLLTKAVVTSAEIRFRK